MSLQDMVVADVHSIFLNLNEFAEKRTVIYDGATYTDISVVISGMKEKDRRVLVSDHIQGLYRVTSTLHCAKADIGGKQPEKGTKIRISTKAGGTFFRDFYVASSVSECGMLRVELEAIDE